MNKIVKSIIKKNIFFLFFLFACNLLFSQKIVTIQECQEWAISHSSANVQKELNEQLLKVKLNDVSSHLYPTLEMNGAVTLQSHVPQLPLNIQGIDMLSCDHYGISVDFSQVIFDGARFFYGRKYERMMNKTEIHKIELSINELKERIITIYLNLLIIDKQITLLSSVENTIQEQLEQLRVLFKEGVVYGNAVAQLELEELKIDQQKGELAATKSSLIGSLAILTGVDLANAQFIVPKIPAIENNDNSSRLEFAIFHNSKAGLDYQRKLHFANSLPNVKVFTTAG